MLLRVVHRRWLYIEGLYLYSRPYVKMQLYTSGHVYSRPHGLKRRKRSVPLKMLEILLKGIPQYPFCSIQVVTVQALPRVGRVAERSEAGWVLHRSFNLACVHSPYKFVSASALTPSRTPHPAPRNLERESTGACRSEANPEYRICLKPQNGQLTLN